MNIEKEEWKPIIGYEGLYDVSSWGNVRSLDRIVVSKNGAEYPKIGIPIKTNDDGNGYLKCNLNSNGVPKMRRIHQLVAESFLGHNRFVENIVVDHKNGIKHDNNISNLGIKTKRENNTVCFRKNRDKFTSKYIGVSLDKSCKKWMAYIQIAAKYKYLGRFDSEIDASNAYQTALKNYLEQ